MPMPILETDRIRIRPFFRDDLAAVYQLLDIDLQDANMGTDGAQTLEERRRWLEWSILNYEQLEKLHQPPYGDRAIVLRENGLLIGACGYVPVIGPYEQIPSLRQPDTRVSDALYTPECGIFYAISPSYQRKGYAAEAATALVTYAFQHLRLKRIIATTAYENEGSMGVMRKLHMQIEKNPLSSPPWLQIVGKLDNGLI